MIKDLQVWGHLLVNFEAIGNEILYVVMDFPLKKLMVVAGGRAQVLNISEAEMTPG